MAMIHELNVQAETFRVRQAAERGHATYDWLDTWHTFSFNTGEQIRHELQPGRHAWLQVLRGSVQLNDRFLEASDGAAVSNDTILSIRANKPSEAMLFDLK